MMSKKAVNQCLAVAIVAGLSAGVTNAAPVSWDNGAGNSLWASPTNWSTDNLPAAADDVTFGTGMTNNQVIDLGGNRTINSLIFNPNVANFSLGTAATANVLTIGSGSISRTNNENGSININAGVLLGANGVFSNAAIGGRQVRLIGALSDGGNNYSVTIASGEFRFDAVNTYGGGTVIQSGGRLFLDQANNNSLGAAGVTVQSGGYLDMKGANQIGAGQKVQVDSGGVLALNGNYNPASMLAATSSGIVAIRANNNTITDLTTLGNGSMFLGASGNNTLTSASLAVGNGNTYRLGGGGNFVLTIQNAVLTGNNNVVIGQAGGSGRVIYGAAMNYSGTTRVNAGHTLGATVSNAIPSGNIDIESLGGLNFRTDVSTTHSNNITMLGTNVVIDTNGVNFPNYVTLSGVISDGGNGYRLALGGASLLGLGAQNNANIALTNQNTFSGGTHIDGNGIDLVIAASSTVDGGGNIISGPYGTGDITTGGGSGGTAPYKHRYHVLNGHRIIHNNWAVVSESRFNVAAGSSLTLAGNVTGGTGTWFDKWDQGTLALTGNTTVGTNNNVNSFVGVMEGVMQVDGTLSAFHGVRVAGGTLGGSGVINGNVAFAARGNRSAWWGVVGGTIAPGSSLGILQVGTATDNRTVDFTIAASGTLQNGIAETLGTATFLVELLNAVAGTGHDQLKVFGNVILANATLDVELLPGFSANPGDAFTIINTNNGTLTGTFAGLNEGDLFNVDGNQFSITYAGGAGHDVVLTFIPEPGSLALLAAGLGLIGVRRRRV